MHLKGFNDKKGKWQYKEHEMHYDPRLISREDTDGARDNCLLCITRAGYSKRGVCFGLVSPTFTDFDLSLMVFELSNFCYFVLFCFSL